MTLFSFFLFFLFLTLHHSTPMTLKVIKVGTLPKRMVLLTNNSMELIKGKEMLHFYLVKFIYSEKATKFCKICTVDSTV